MESLPRRIEIAEEWWARGLQAEQAGDLPLAYQCFTDAHDAIMDCARLHQYAHVQLRRVNRPLGHYGEWITDWLLHCFAPLGVFELVAYFAKTGALGSALCKRA